MFVYAGTNATNTNTRIYTHTRTLAHARKEQVQEKQGLNTLRLRAWVFTCSHVPVHLSSITQTAPITSSDLSLTSAAALGVRALARTCRCEW